MTASEYKEIVGEDYIA
ncbi:hypothetical protein [Clostridioides difficile]